VGWMQPKQFWLPAQGEVFSLDIPFYRTSGWPVTSDQSEVDSDATGS
jgi:hypothetical protein